MRLCTGTNYAAGIIVSLWFLSSLASPLEASSIDFRPVCPFPGDRALDSCITTNSVPLRNQSSAMNLTVSSAGATITDSIQGSMSVTVPASDTYFDLYVRQAIIPLPGILSFNNNFEFLVWADQPVTGNLMVSAVTCSSFIPLSGPGSGGDCMSALMDSPVPYLGTDPDLAKAAVNGASVGETVYIAPGGTVSSGYWENIFSIRFYGGTAPTHVNILFTEGSASFRSAVLAPEPATAVELGVGLGFMLLIAYRRRRVVGSHS